MNSLIDRKILNRDEEPHFYVYSQIMDGREQTGIIGLNSIDDYENNKIKKHEHTLPKKEQDRINNFIYCKAHTEPIMLIHKRCEAINAVIAKIKQNPAEYDFTDEQGVRQMLWVVGGDDCAAIESAFAGMDCVYIADGHHRAASSYRSGLIMREKTPGCKETEEFNYIMSAIISEDDLYVMDYNRLVTDLGSYSVSGFIEALREDFEITEKNQMYIADKKHVFSMYAEGRWYAIEAKSGSFDENDPIKSLDASILQANVFDKLLSIKDPRTSDRLQFIGGIRGYEELKQAVDSNRAKAAFGVYPVSINDLINVADKGLIMPPKSTWFEPKLRSGLIVHQF